MPNWCANKLSVTGPKKVISQIKSAVGFDNGKFDFNGIVKMPDELKITKGSETNWAKEVLEGRWESILEIPHIFKSIAQVTQGMLPGTRQELINLLDNPSTFYERIDAPKAVLSLQEGRQAIANRARYGFEDWYDWSIAYWGTKWNVDEVNVIDESAEGFMIDFDTAWTPPIALIQSLCEAYPAIEATLHYVELGAFFAGTVEGRDGEIVDIAANEVSLFAEEVFGLSLE